VNLCLCTARLLCLLSILPALFLKTILQASIPHKTNDEKEKLKNKKG
jgi:hypothetical protein